MLRFASRSTHPYHHAAPSHHHQPSPPSSRNMSFSPSFSTNTHAYISLITTHTLLSPRLPPHARHLPPSPLDHSAFLYCHLQDATTLLPHIMQACLSPPSLTTRMSSKVPRTTGNPLPLSYPFSPSSAHPRTHIRPGVSLLTRVADYFQVTSK